MQLDNNTRTYFNPYTRSITTDLERDTKHLTDEEKRKLVSYNYKPLKMYDPVKARQGRMSPMQFAPSTSLDKSSNAITFAKGARAVLSQGFQITLGEKSFEWSGDVQRNPIGLTQAVGAAKALADLIRLANGQIDHLTISGEGLAGPSAYALEGLRAFGIDTNRDFSINGTKFFVNGRGEIQRKDRVDAQMAYEYLGSNSRMRKLTAEETSEAVDLLSKHYLPNASDETMQAWKDAMKETGFEPFEWGETSTIKILSAEQDIAAGNPDLFGGTTESAINGVEKILNRLHDTGRRGNVGRGENVAREENAARNAEERAFYQCFLGKLHI